MEDKKITEMFFNKDETAIKLLLEKYGRLLKKLSFNVLNNEEDAEECVNDTCVEIWNSIPPNKPDILLSYACKIVRRISINRLKFNLRQKRSSDKTVCIDELTECFSMPDIADDIVDSLCLRNAINEFLRSIDEESRNLFVKRYFFLESISALSEHFGISENKVSVKLHRIRKKLAEKLKEEGFYEE